MVRFLDPYYPQGKPEVSSNEKVYRWAQSREMGKTSFGISTAGAQTSSQAPFGCITVTGLKTNERGGKRMCVALLSIRVALALEQWKDLETVPIRGMGVVLFVLFTPDARSQIRYSQAIHLALVQGPREQMGRGWVGPY